MKKTLLFILLLLTFTTLTAEESPFVPGTIVFKTTTDFTKITVKTNGIIETEQKWFNDMADKYEISVLKKRFAFTNVIF